MFEPLVENSLDGLRSRTHDSPSIYDPRRRSFKWDQLQSFKLREKKALEETAGNFMNAFAMRPPAQVVPSKLPFQSDIINWTRAVKRSGQTHSKVAPAARVPCDKWLPFPSRPSNRLPPTQSTPISFFYSYSYVGRLSLSFSVANDRYLLEKEEEEQKKKLLKARRNAFELDKKGSRRRLDLRRTIFNDSPM
ncbi:unnamed protein product [Caenorhabditis auriculariae]|uniref:Uncharacterized protein n=1 Tax=Caenorhabditis auriculariae TaxID=2777116 RepID=A0A8S1HN45_9PELO|nr:unnamed protein product [Caenorhabditis auriculariae]